MLMKRLWLTLQAQAGRSWGWRQEGGVYLRIKFNQQHNLKVGIITFNPEMRKIKDQKHVSDVTATAIL